MHFNLIWERITGVIFLPKGTWVRMRKESGYVLESLLFLLTCCAIVGLSSLLSGHDESWAPETFILFSSLLLMSVIIRTFSPKMRKINWEGSLNLLVYSSYLTLLIYALSMLLGGRNYLLPIGLIVAILFYGTGLKQMLSLSWKDCSVYTLITFIAMAACLYWGRVFLSF